MGKKIARFFIVLVGFFIGPGIVALILDILEKAGFLPLLDIWTFTAYAGSALVTGVLFILLSKPIVSFIFKSAGEADKKISKLPSNVVIPGIFGLVIGLVVALLLSSLISGIMESWLPWLASLINVIIYIICAYLGVTIFIRHRPASLSSMFSKRGKDDEQGPEDTARPKLLDTSVIIDGRIFDICQTGIIEGTIVIPEFVLDELRHIADSSDDLKRNRGRRGLDVLKRIQTELNLPVNIVRSSTNEAADVDSKLLTLANEMGGIVVTNDYNLNKVAAVKSVSVFNINELANAVKPVVLPGEEMVVTIVKDGKEPGQGVAYLDDGTMIVVEGGKSEQNKPAEVIVTSVLQTAAGRMIFAKLK